MRWLFTWSSNRRSFTGKFLVSWMDGHVGSRTWRFVSTYSHNTSQPVFSIPQGEYIQQRFIQGSSRWGPTRYYFITIFDGKGSGSFVPRSIDRWYPYHIPSLELCISFNFCKCNVFKIWTNHKAKTISRLFSLSKNTSVSPFGVFYRPRQEIFTPFHVYVTSKSGNRYPSFWGSLCIWAIMGSTSPLGNLPVGLIPDFPLL